MEETYTFHVIDGILAGIVFISGVIALVRGFARESLGIISWVLALFAALYTHQYTYDFWYDVTGGEMAAHIVAFLSVFVGVLTTTLLFTNRMSNYVGQGPLNSLDRTFGFLFGLVRGVVILALLYLILISVDEESKVPDWLAEARTLPYVKQSADFLISLLPDGVQDSMPHKGEYRVRRAADGTPKPPRRGGSLTLEDDQASDQDSDGDQGESAPDDGLPYGTQERQQMDQLFNSLD